MSSQPALRLFAQGKLLLTGEYVVLDGALALALPVRYGQTLEVEVSEAAGRLSWESLDEKGHAWFWGKFSLPGFDVLYASSTETAARLQQILQACRKQNPAFLQDGAGWNVRTRIDFPRAWGLGTSSTLIAAVAQWAAADPYVVLFDTFGGSGYDIACAFAGGPLLYRLEAGRPVAGRAPFDPVFAGQLFFVFLGKKQNSLDGIRHYRARAHFDPALIGDISGLTQQLLDAQTLDQCCSVLLEHERRIARALDLPRVQELYFPDFPGVVKSLGAWGGDFVLAAGRKAPAASMAYFRQKGYDVCIPYREMAL
ncbi:MAG: GHMP kinase [Saprospirales bacterium]|nr:GHMP kinase [Saprospirales bacterium]